MSFQPRRIARAAASLAALATLAAVVFSSPPAAAATIGLAPSSQSAEIGDSISVDIVIAELGGEVVSAYDLDLLYDSSILAASDLIFTSALGDELLFEVFSGFDLSGPGVVDFAQLSLILDAELFALQGGDAVHVATVYFEAIAPGTSSLDFVLDAVNDVKGRDARILPVQPTGGSITVERSTLVPEPSAALVFGMGALVLRARVRRGPKHPSRNARGQRPLSGR